MDDVLSILNRMVQTAAMNGYAIDLKQRREAAGMTVRELAHRIERSTTFITDFELKKKSNPPEPEMMQRLADALHWPVVEQLAAWGYTVDLIESRANPFERDDPRWQFVEALKQLDLSDEYDAYVAVTVATMLRTMQAERERFKAGVIAAYRETAKRD